jgi:hypothetical protein
VILFSNTITPRLQFIAEFIGHEITAEPLSITESISEFRKHDGPRINYSDQRLGDREIWIRPHKLLFEKGIIVQPIECFELNGHKVFFKTEGDIQFDILAAGFYLLTRYEEYLPHEKDMYGRYAHKNSLAYKNDFLGLPLINKWIQTFKEVLHNRFSPFVIHNPPFTFLPTYDIDEAWSYKNKLAWRSFGAVLKAFLKGKWNKIAERKRVLSGKSPDPFDSYDWMDALHEKFNLQPKYFFLVPGRTGKYDRNILPDNKELQLLIKRHAGKYDVGIHPSWQSGDDPLLLHNEKLVLEKIIGRPVFSSRQHFIRLTLPETYRFLLQEGITNDFSMGYGSINGFRASVASPFFWYDLEKEEKTALRLYPFCYMEANSFFEQSYTPEKALEELQHYYNEIKAVDGLFISIWHNTFLGTDPMFAGWREVYEQFITRVS